MFAAMVEQLNDDDRDFMLNLYKNYYNLTRKNIYCFTRSQTDIEDLINDVFVKLIEKVSLLRTFDCCRITTYIVYTIKSVSINYVKHKAVETKHIYCSNDMEYFEDFYQSGTDFDDKLIREDKLALLKKAILLLPQKQKDLLYFKYLLEMKDSEIAEMLGIAPDSVREYLTRARRNAKHLMEIEMSSNGES